MSRSSSTYRALKLLRRIPEEALLAIVKTHDYAETILDLPIALPNSVFKYLLDAVNQAPYSRVEALFSRTATAYQRAIALSFTHCPDILDAFLYYNPLRPEELRALAQHEFDGQLVLYRYRTDLEALRVLMGILPKDLIVFNVNDPRPLHQRLSFQEITPQILSSSIEDRYCAPFEPLDTSFPLYPLDLPESSREWPPLGETGYDAASITALIGTSAHLWLRLLTQLDAADGTSSMRQVISTTLRAHTLVTA